MAARVVQCQPHAFVFRRVGAVELHQEDDLRSWQQALRKELVLESQVIVHRVTEAKVVGLGVDRIGDAALKADGALHVGAGQAEKGREGAGARLTVMSRNRE